MCVCTSERVCVFVLSFPIPHISCLWFRRQRGPSHESRGVTQTSADLWLAAVTQRGRQRERKGKREAHGARDGLGWDGAFSYEASSLGYDRTRGRGWK